MVSARLKKILRKSDTMARDTKKKYVAQYLMDHNGMKNNYTVSRSGGDEFLILVQGIGERNDIAVVAQKIIDSLNKPIKLVTEHGKFYLPEGVGAS
jgi:GGDEF domain-containing protein